MAAQSSKHASSGTGDGLHASNGAGGLALPGSATPSAAVLPTPAAAGAKRPLPSNTTGRSGKRHRSSAGDAAVPAALFEADGLGGSPIVDQQ